MARPVSSLQYGLGAVLSATKASAALPQAGDEYDFYRSFPGFQEFCESQGDKLLHWWEKCVAWLDMHLSLPVDNPAVAQLSIPKGTKHFVGCSSHVNLHSWSGEGKGILKCAAFWYWGNSILMVSNDYPSLCSGMVVYTMSIIRICSLLSDPRHHMSTLQVTASLTLNCPFKQKRASA